MNENGQTNKIADSIAAVVLQCFFAVGGQRSQVRIPNDLSSVPP